MPRPYDLVDMDLVKHAPFHMGEDGYILLGRQEFWIREKGRQVRFVNDLVHGLVKRARQAHLSQGTESPWDEQFERVGPVGPAAPVAKPEPVRVDVPLPDTARPATRDHVAILVGRMTQSVTGQVLGWQLTKYMQQECDMEATAVETLIERLVHLGTIERVKRGVYRLPEAVL